MNFITADIETVRANPVLGEVLREAEAKAVAKAKAEAKAEGVTEGVAKSVLALLDDRQVPLTEAQRERVLAVHDGELLQRWLLAAPHVGSADELFS